MKAPIVSQMTYLLGFHDHSNHSKHSKDWNVQSTQTQKERNSKQAWRLFGCQLSKTRQKIKKKQLNSCKTHYGSVLLARWTQPSCLSLIEVSETQSS